MNVHQKINAVMRAVHLVQKTGKQSGGGGNFDYHKHDDVTYCLREAMIEHGLVCYPRCFEFVRTDRIVKFMVELKYVGMDDGDAAIVIVPAESAAKGKNAAIVSDDKQIGVALSYAIKNAQLKVFMLTDKFNPDAEEREGDRRDEPSGQAAPAQRPQGDNPYAAAAATDETVGRATHSAMHPQGARDSDQRQMDWAPIISDMLTGALQIAQRVANGDNSSPIEEAEKLMAEGFGKYKEHEHTMHATDTGALNELAQKARAAIKAVKS